MELEFNQTEEGVVNEVIIILGMRGKGKTRLMEALAPLLAPREKLVIVSPIGTLKSRMPDLKWYKISVINKGGIEKLFRGWLDPEAGQRHILCDEADELTAANAAGTAGGFVSQAVYDYINYGREQGLGITLSSRRPSNIAKDITANANHAFVAQTVDPAALDYYSAWMRDPTHPEIDYRARCRTLPDYWFMVWSPGKKYLGVVTVNMATMEIEEPPPDQVKSWEDGASSARDTGPTDTTGTDSSESEPDRGSGNDAGSVTSGSGTVPEPPTAKSI